MAFPLITHVTYGLKGFVFYLLIVFTAIIEAEIVEYIEHYGLFVTKDNKITHDCAWNSSQRFVNIASFKLERHADHHVNAYKQY